MILQFLSPYLALVQLASWGLAQNLEGLGLFTYLNSQPMQVGNVTVYPLNLNPAVGVANLAVVLTGALVTVFLLNIRASFHLNKWVGSTAVGLWLLPGLLSLVGLMPDIRGMGPDVFRFGEGFPGGMESAAANLLICLVGGWSLLLLLGSLWKRDTFKNAYDHVWYTLGLITALYFVVDAGLQGYKTDLVEADARLVRTLQMFRTAQERLEVLCADPEAAELAPALCAQAPTLKWKVRTDLNMEAIVRAKMGTSDWAAQLAIDPRLALEIEALNTWACTRQQRLAQCQPVPFSTALSSHDVDEPIVFPHPRYAEALQKSHAALGKADSRIHDIEQGHNLRYFGFLMIAILAGGKLANASRAMLKVDPGRPRSWTLRAIKYASRLGLRLLWCVSTLATEAWSFFIRHAAAQFARHKAGEAGKAASCDQPDGRASEQN